MTVAWYFLAMNTFPSNFLYGIFIPAYSSCTNDPVCAGKAVENYMNKFGQVKYQYRILVVRFKFIRTLVILGQYFRVFFFFLKNQYKPFAYTTNDKSQKHFPWRDVSWLTRLKIKTIFLHWIPNSFLYKSKPIFFYWVPNHLSSLNSKPSFFIEFKTIFLHWIQDYLSPWAIKLLTHLHWISAYCPLPWFQDCNGDGRIDCRDYAAIHRLGGYGCSAPLDPTYLGRFNKCLSDVAQLNG